MGGSESRFILKPLQSDQSLRVRPNEHLRAHLGRREHHDRLQKVVLKLHNAGKQEFFIHFDQHPQPRLGASLAGQVLLHEGGNLKEGDLTWRLHALGKRRSGDGFNHGHAPEVVSLAWKDMKDHALLVALQHVRSRRFLAVHGGEITLCEYRPNLVESIRPEELWDMECVDHNLSRNEAIAVTVGTIAPAVVLGVAAPAIAVAAVGSLGFGAGGVAAGSAAAGMMAAEGSVAAGSAVAAMQSIGATGSLAYLGAGAALVPTVGVGVGASVGAAGVAIAQAALPNRTVSGQLLASVGIRRNQTLSGTFHIKVAGGTHLSKDHLSCRADGLVDLWSHDDESGRQKWRLCAVEGNVYTIAIAGGTDEGKKYLSCTASGLVDLWSHVGCRQKWRLEQLPHGPYKITVFGGTEPGKHCLSCTASGYVDLWSHDDGSGRQQWWIDLLET